MSVAAAFADLLPSFLSPSDLADVEDVLQAAVEWAEGRMPIEAFARVGTIENGSTKRPSPGFSRYCAVCLCGEDPRRAALLAAIDELIVFQGFRLTNHGVFRADDLHGMTIHYGRAA